MEELGTAVNELDTILALTMGLPPAYDPVIINFDSTPSDQLMFNNVVARLLNEETRQLSVRAITPTSDHPPKNAALYTANHCTPNLDITCHFCGKKGHFKSQCRERVKWEEHQKREGVNTVAFTATVEDNTEDDVVW